jgi:LPXTG-motif cell wall-anchored protein
MGDASSTSRAEATGGQVYMNSATATIAIVAGVVIVVGFIALALRRKKKKS